jgi:hypothetical protein
MNSIFSKDTKLEKMILKTIYFEIFENAENIIKECDNTLNNISNETYFKLFLRLNEIVNIIQNYPPIDKNDYLNALLIQNNLINKMFLYLENNLSNL